MTHVIRVLLAEDHETVREGLKLLVNGQPDMTVVAEAADGQSAVDKARELRPQAIVIDLNMPLMNGLVATRIIRTALPSSAVVVLTRHNDRAYVQEMLDAGAQGYVLKKSSSAELLTAIRVVATGGRYVDPALREDAQPLAASGRRLGTPSVTEREREVLRHMALGHSNKEIADRLDISVKTVEVHKANAMRKLGLRGRSDVIKFAALNGWLEDP